MEKFFNNAGPQQPANNYTLDPLRRIKLDESHGLIDQQRYFVLHAPRQTGKTTALYAMMRHYNAGSQYRALYVNTESAQAFREDVINGIGTVCGTLASAASLHLKDDSLEQAYTAWKATPDWGKMLTQCIKHLSAHDNAQSDNPAL